MGPGAMDTEVVVSGGVSMDTAEGIVEDVEVFLS